MEILSKKDQSYRPFTPSVDMRSRGKLHAALHKTKLDVSNLTGYKFKADTDKSSICIESNKLYYNPFWIVDTDMKTFESELITCITQHNDSCAVRLKAWESACLNTDTNRIGASLIAFACADALGATVEFRTAEEITRDIGVHKDITGDGWLFLEPGEVTDDTQMATCIARSLVECQGFNMKDIAAKFVDWYNSDPPDIGSTCRRGIHRYIRTGNLEAPYDDRGAGNGGVMRELPLILLYSQDRELMLNTVVSQSRLTHNHPESDMGCRCYAELVAAALHGNSKDDLRKIADKYPLFAPNTFDGKSTAYTVDTMRTVLHYFFATESLEEYVVAVVNNGQDADTTGALAGGLAGAFYKMEAIPARWLDVLDRTVHDELVQLAEQLSAMKESL